MAVVVTTAEEDINRLRRCLTVRYILLLESPERPLGLSDARKAATTTAEWAFSEKFKPFMKYFFEKTSILTKYIAPLRRN